MSDHEEDAGILAAVVTRLNHHRLPRLLDLQAKVTRGEAVNDLDLQFLERVLEDARALYPLVERNPEAQPLYTRVMALHAAILDDAVRNGQNNSH